MEETRGIGSLNVGFVGKDTDMKFFEGLWGIKMHKKIVEIPESTDQPIFDI